MPRPRRAGPGVGPDRPGRLAQPAAGPEIPSGGDAGAEAAASSCTASAPVTVTYTPTVTVSAKAYAAAAVDSTTVTTLTSYVTVIATVSGY